MTNFFSENFFRTLKWTLSQKIFCHISCSFGRWLRWHKWKFWKLLILFINEKIQKLWGNPPSQNMVTGKENVSQNMVTRKKNVSQIVVTRKKLVSQIVVTGKKNVSQIVVTGKDFILSVSSAEALRSLSLWPWCLSGLAEFQIRLILMPKPFSYDLYPGRWEFSNQNKEDIILCIVDWSQKNFSTHP